MERENEDREKQGQRNKVSVKESEDDVSTA